MQLLILIIIAGVIGYFVSRSRLSRPIDSASEKVADSSRSAADKAEGWWRRTFGKKDETASQVIEGSAVDADPQPANPQPPDPQPAEKQPSRRKSTDTTPEAGE